MHLNRDVESTVLTTVGKRYDLGTVYCILRNAERLKQNAERVERRRHRVRRVNAHDCSYHGMSMLMICVA